MSETTVLTCQECGAVLARPDEHHCFDACRAEKAERLLLELRRADNDCDERLAEVEAAIARVEALPPEMLDRAGVYHPKEQRRGAAAHQELQEWRRAILAALDGGEEWESVYRPRHTAAVLHGESREAK